VYGLNASDIRHDIDLSLDYPSLVSSKLLQGDAELGLVPVASIPALQGARIVSDYCIGASKAVASVKLLSTVPLEEIRNVHLDYQSRTSVTLVQVLARHYWKVSPLWIPAREGYERNVSPNDAAVVIGDRVFALAGTYPYEYDLAEEWIRFTGLPFVFACWVSVKDSDADFIERFNEALGFGLNNKVKVLDAWRSRVPKDYDIMHYLENNIDYRFDDEKKKGMKLFLEYATAIGSLPEQQRDHTNSVETI
jgi:chorismate dehydratase